VETPPDHTAGRAAARRALLDTAPLVLGYLPFGLVLGATIVSSALPNLAGWATSPLIFAGAAQLAVIDLLGAGVPTVVVLATVVVINLRHVMYSGALAPWFRDSPLSWRLVAPHLLADPVYTLSAVRFREIPGERERRIYYGTLGAALMTAWMSMTALGILVGAALPVMLDLELAVPLVFLALLGPTVTDRPAAVAAAVGAGATVAAQGLPLRLGLIVGALSGVGAALVFDLARPSGATGASPGGRPR
jgi:predicted branched-subunit amino acid permease